MRVEIILGVYYKNPEKYNGEDRSGTVSVSGKKIGLAIC